MTLSERNRILHLLDILSKNQKCVPKVSPEASELVNFNGFFRAGNLVCMESLVPLALRGIELGASPYTVSKFLDWRDFESLVTRYLTLSGWEAIHSLRLKSRRFELDVIGVNPVSRIGLVIDCKHWSPGYYKKTKLKNTALQHRSKVELLRDEFTFHIAKYPVLKKCVSLVPAVVTLTECVKGFYEGSFIVPIQTFRDFLNNLDIYLDEVGSNSYVRIVKSR